MLRTAMILAAGNGTRLRPLTDNMPKPLVNVGGEPVIFRTLKLLAGAGINRVVINTSYLATMLEREVRAHSPKGLQVMFSHEEELLETGGGVKKALPLLGQEPFLVVNSDAVWLEDQQPLLRPLMENFNLNQHDVLMAVVPLERVKGVQPLGDFKFDSKTKLLNRKGKKETFDVVYAGVHVTHAGLFAREAAARFSLNVLWTDAEERKRLQGFMYDSPWVEMGTHVGLLRAREMVRGTPE